MKVRIYCIICNIGVSGEDYDQPFQQRAIEMMVYHTQIGYKRLAAHDKGPPSMPSYRVEFEQNKIK